MGGVADALERLTEFAKGDRLSQRITGLEADLVTRSVEEAALSLTAEGIDNSLLHAALDVSGLRVRST